MFKRYLSLTLLALLPLSVSAASGDVSEFKLDNGLRLIVKEDHRAPVMVSQIWYKVGSAFEHNGLTGLSHVLEHMMFKGTEKHPPGEFSRIISAQGGSENAFTSRDYTAYFQQLEKSRLPIAFELEADRMRNLILPADEFAKEVQVVMEERRMRTEDDPESLTYEQFLATAYTNSPYQHPVIGWMTDLEAMKVEDLRAWYDTYYRPNNATLVVVGDVDPKQVFELAKKYYGATQPNAVPELKPRREVEQKGERRIAVKAPAELPYLMMGYKVPSAKTTQEEWEPYALEVLAGVLDGGDSARFARELVRGKQIAASAGAGYTIYAAREELFMLDGRPTQEHTVAELEQALREQIARLRDTLPSAEELARVKAQVVAGKVYERDSIFYQAMQIGTLVTIGLDWRLMDQYVDKVKAITAEQVQAVARKYLTDERLTVAVLDPQPIEDKAAPAAKGGARHGR